MAAPGVDQRVLARLTQTESLLERGKLSAFKLEPRVELLVRACHAANVAVRDTTPGDYEYPLSPRTEQIVTHLARVLARDEALSAQVLKSLGGYRRATRALTRIEEGLLSATSTQDEDVEELQKALQFLSRFNAPFQSDPVLAQVFPAPVTLNAGTATPAPVPASPVTAAPAPAPAVDPILTKIQNLLTYLAPRMETVRMVVSMLDPTQVARVDDIMSPAARQARLIVKAIQSGNRPLLGQLHEAYNTFNLMTRDIRLVSPATDIEPLRKQFFTLRRLTVEFHRSPLLKEVFPPGAKFETF